MYRICKGHFQKFRVPFTVHWICVPVSLWIVLEDFFIVFLYLLLFVQVDQCVLYQEQTILPM